MFDTECHFVTVFNATDWGESNGERFGTTIKLLEDFAIGEPDHVTN